MWWLLATMILSWSHGQCSCVRLYIVTSMEVPNCLEPECAYGPELTDRGAFIAFLDKGHLCLDRVLDELRVRPPQRFVWGSTRKRCSEATLEDLSSAGLLVISRDVLQRPPMSSLTVFNDERIIDAGTTRLAARRFCDAGMIYTNDRKRVTQNFETWRGHVVQPPRTKTPAILRCDDDSGGSKQEPPKTMDWSLKNETCCETETTTECSGYRGRSFRKKGDSKAVLASFPGSGNTWVRLLLEYGSGYLTGSVYDDNELKKVLPAEGNTENVLAVKAHLMPSQYLSYVPGARIVLLTRHPLNAIWAEFQRRSGVLRQDKDTHVHVINEVGPAMTRVFAAFATCMSCKWAVYAWVHARDDVYYARYEDFLHDAPSALDGALRFLGLSIDSNRLQCAPKLAVGVKRPTTKKLQANDVFVGSLACASWSRVLGNRHSRALVQRMRYDPPPDFSRCPPSFDLSHDCGDPKTAKTNCAHTVSAASLAAASFRDLHHHDNASSSSSLFRKTSRFPSRSHPFSSSQSQSGLLRNTKNQHRSFDGPPRHRRRHSPRESSDLFPSLDRPRRRRRRRPSPIEEV